MESSIEDKILKLGNECFSKEYVRGVCEELSKMSSILGQRRVLKERVAHLNSANSYMLLEELYLAFLKTGKNSKDLQLVFNELLTQIVKSGEFTYIRRLIETEFIEPYLKEYDVSILENTITELLDIERGDFEIAMKFFDSVNSKLRAGKLEEITSKLVILNRSPNLDTFLNKLQTTNIESFKQCLKLAVKSQLKDHVKAYGMLKKYKSDFSSLEFSSLILMYIESVAASSPYTEVVQIFNRLREEKQIQTGAIASFILKYILKYEDKPIFVEYFNEFSYHQLIERDMLRSIMHYLTEKKDESTALLLLHSMLRNKEVFLSINLPDNEYKFLLLCLFKSQIAPKSEEGLQQRPVLKPSQTIEDNIDLLLDNISEQAKDDDSNDWIVI